MTLHHLGIVAKNLESALATFRIDKSNIVEKVEDSNQGNLLYFIKYPNSNFVLEIIIPTRANSTVSNFALKHNVGLHHLAFKTDSVSSSTDEHRSMAGHFPLGQYEINVDTFGGLIKTSFVSANGNLIEYVENV